MSQEIEEQEPQDYVIGSTNAVRLVEWEDTDTGGSPTDWTVTLTAVYDSSGTNPMTGTQNIAMPFVAASPGFKACYKGVVPSTASLIAGACTTRVTATAVGGTKVRRFDVPGTVVANN